MIDIDGIAKNLAKKTGHKEDQWSEFLTEAIHDPAFSTMTDGEIDLLSQSVQSPDQLKWLIHCFRQSRFRLKDETAYDYLIKHVNISAFDLTAWLETLHWVAGRASKEDKNQSLEVLIEFVLGCVGSEPHTKKPMLDIVQSTVAKQGL